MSKLSAILFAAGMAVSFAPLPAYAITSIETYYFTGTCADCTGTGTGTLVLEGYTLGTQIVIDQLRELHLQF